MNSKFGDDLFAVFFCIAFFISKLIVCIPTVGISKILLWLYLEAFIKTPLSPFCFRSFNGFTRYMLGCNGLVFGGRDYTQIYF